MTGTTTGQTALPTATDSDDVELYGTTSLVTALQTLANLFESATGHDHSGAGKGRPVGTAGIASGITLTSPHMTSPVVDSGGLTITAGALVLPNAAHTIAGSGSLAFGTTPGAGGLLRFPNNNTINWRNAANSGDDTLGFDSNDRLVITTSAAAGGVVSGASTDSFFVLFNGVQRRVPLY